MPGFYDHVGKEVGEKYLQAVDLGMPKLPDGIKYDRGRGWTAWDVTPEPEHGGIGITEELADDIVVMHAIRVIGKTNRKWVRGLAEYPREKWISYVVAYYAMEASTE